jgi:cytochrome c-type biogenesis protein
MRSRRTAFVPISIEAGFIDKTDYNVNNTWVNVNWLVAFVGGVLSFFSPCVLPLVPSFLIYISGASIHQASDLANTAYRKKIVLHSISFIAGFSFVFISLGLSSSYLGYIFNVYDKWIMRIGGILLIIMGLAMLNVLKIPLLSREKMIHLNDKPAGFLGSFVVGVTFSLGWTPCIGPVLASILLIASTAGSALSGVYLLSFYSLGLAIPFFIAALLVSRLMGFMRRWGHIVQYTSSVLGVLLVLLGLFRVSGYWRTVTAWLS